MATRFNGGIIGVRNSTTVGLTTGRFSSNEILLSLKDGTWPIPPVNVSVPVISGSTLVGGTLTSTTGTWNNSPTSFAYQWQRGTSDIGGATSSTYTAVTADVGSTLRCVVTATNASGSVPAASANTAVVAVVQGQLWNWGGGAVGVLGQVSNTTSHSSPVQVGSATNWTYSATSQYTSLAVNSLGQLWSWGNAGYYGQSGHNDLITRSSPTQVGALTNWQKVFNDQQVCCAIKTDGTLWAWGRNYYGNLGDGTTTNRSSPVQITGSTNWVTASQGGAFSGTFAINSLGELWSTGKNLVGQLGLNDITNRSSLTQVPGTDWRNVFAGGALCHAIKTDGTMWGWGPSNYSRGCVGDGTEIKRSSPVQIGALTTWATLRKGNYYSKAALKTDGTMWAWGRNSYGQLGQNHTDPRSSPVQVGALTTWVSVTNAGGAGCLARKTDGTIWAWGRNTDGALGIGNTDNRSSPVQIGALTTWVINGFGGTNHNATSAIKSP